MALDLTGIGTAAEAAKKILGMFFPDKTEIEISKLAGTLSLLNSQTDIDKAEAQSSDPLQHWRGGLGWVCVLSYLNNFIIVPYAVAFGVKVPVLDTSSLFTLTLGMLGLGGMHAYQSVKGAS